MLDDNAAETPQGPVQCLGMTFENDEARRDHFLEKLREKLQDPAFRAIEGFPLGSDEDILRLSDPPYYTACPNPFLAEFIRCHGKPHDATNNDYRRGPFAADVSEGKNDSVYNAHSYHTKVPHKAIMRYILHYTEPGDIVFDGFSGTGMTGVAAQLCGDREAVDMLDYAVLADGIVMDEHGQAISKIGPRPTILSDLSPFAGFVAAQYNHFSPAAYASSTIAAPLHKLRSHWGHLYRTREPETSVEGEADFFVWSEIFSCPHCSQGDTLFGFAVDDSTHALLSQFNCPSCAALLSKEDLIRSWTNIVDLDGRSILREAKAVLVEVAATIRGRSRRYPPSPYDIRVLDQVQGIDRSWVPDVAFPHGRQTRKVKSGSGISKVHQMFTGRALLIASHAWELAFDRVRNHYNRDLLFLLSASLTLISKRERYRDGTGKGAQSGTLYVPSLQIEKNFFGVVDRKRRSLTKVHLQTHPDRAAISSQSHACMMNIPSNSIDYIFTDPPFGESLQYGELNFFHESWLKVFTDISDDCVLNYVHNKDLAFYRELMRRSFTEALRVLKFGHWITVEFHNSQNSVWMAIQESLSQSGFVVADVRVLDKRQGTFNVVNRAGAVKQDLVISAYKPEQALEQNFKLEAGTQHGAWDFVRAHLRYLPVFVPGKGGDADAIPERMSYLLFDRMVAFHVQRGVSVPLSASEFYAGLDQRFPERDGMYFLPEQVAEYDKRRMQVKEVQQIQLFVTDESSAIQWLRQELRAKPQTFQELHPKFIQEIAGWERYEKALELSSLLAENFLPYDGKGEVPSQIHSYLSSNYKDLRNLSKDDPKLRAEAKDRWYVPDPTKAQDLERLRERELLKEFEEYRASRERTLKVFRLEAVRAGFKRAWQEHDYTTIVRIAQKIPESVLQEDQKLLMWHDQALMRSGTEE